MSTPHIIGVECPTRDRRARLTDDEFWQDVANGLEPEGYVDEPGQIDLDSTTYQDTPCSECGEHGACATDSEGRALIHIQTNGEDE
ncbi:hypothetical protein [Cryobacterium sp. PH31-O1]|uniref:hypothetical protein n=1 Tax=Cryobacterium sp. PH31-O1 TaxID=3046306 RepID=UPI0024BB5B50|nr:hypothetical protein [Cryobacterium sp. PH31-O1]MDJ0337451.1 hypothetical protein [Cryobacterium sp. PH31-O1]